MSAIDVSVVIPTFRREKLVPEAIRSALSQTGVVLQVIVVDDSGNASAREAVRAISDPRLQYVARAKPGGGPAFSRNEGATLAAGRYLHFLDDDDLLEEGALAALTGSLDANPKAGMAFGIITPFGDDAVEVANQQQYFSGCAQIARRLQSTRELVTRLVFNSTIVINSACMVRREIFLASGGYDSEMPVVEDVDLWGRIVRLSGGYVFVDCPIVRYRTGAPSLMNAENLKGKMLISYTRMHAKYRATNGVLEFYLKKIWARAVLR
jgi:glycosyltransferase involved in cell wall biosynthesis